jgi:hypothetical protein
MKTIYQSDDGKTFGSYAECEQYEAVRAGQVDSLITWLNLQDFCHEDHDDPYYTEAYSSAEICRLANFILDYKDTIQGIYNTTTLPGNTPMYTRVEGSTCRHCDTTTNVCEQGCRYSSCV